MRHLSNRFVAKLEPLETFSSKAPSKIALAPVTSIWLNGRRILVRNAPYSIWLVLESVLEASLKTHHYRRASSASSQNDEHWQKAIMYWPELTTQWSIIRASLSTSPVTSGSRFACRTVQRPWRRWTNHFGFQRSTITWRVSTSTPMKTPCAVSAAPVPPNRLDLVFFSILSFSNTHNTKKWRIN